MAKFVDHTLRLLAGPMARPMGGLGAADASGPGQVRRPGRSEGMNEPRDVLVD